MNGRRSKQRRYIRSIPLEERPVLARYYADGSARLYEWFMKGSKKR